MSKFIYLFCLLLITICPGQLVILQGVSAKNLIDPSTKTYEEKRNNKMFQVSTIIIHASAEAIFRTLTDYDEAPAIFSNVKSCKVISEKGVTKDISFHAIALNGLMTFDYVLQVKEHCPTGIEWKRLSGAFKANEGYWKLEPTNDEKSTLVIYSKYVDGGIFLPSFVVKNELRADMPIILNQLKKAVESKQKENH